MIFGIGTDLVEIERIAKVLARHGDRFTGYILTDSEGAEAKRRGDSVQFIAGRWAAKEAVAKHGSLSASVTSAGMPWRWQSRKKTILPLEIFQKRAKVLICQEVRL